jgi:hypothetical protein
MWHLLQCLQVVSEEYYWLTKAKVKEKVLSELHFLLLGKALSEVHFLLLVKGLSEVHFLLLGKVLSEVHWALVRCQVHWALVRCQVHWALVKCQVHWALVRCQVHWALVRCQGVAVALGCLGFASHQQRSQLGRPEAKEEHQTAGGAIHHGWRFLLQKSAAADDALAQAAGT